MAYPRLERALGGGGSIYSGMGGRRRAHTCAHCCKEHVRQRGEVQLTSSQWEREGETETEVKPLCLEFNVERGKWHEGRQRASKVQLL